MPQQKLIAILRQQGCEILPQSVDRFVVLLPGWDQRFLNPMNRPRLIQYLWDRVVVSSQTDTHELKLQYWSAANIVLHAVLCAVVLIGILAQPLTGLQAILLFAFANALLPAAAHVETRLFFSSLLDERY